MQRLQFLIDELTRGRKFHISILDLSGLLDTPITKIKFKNVVHIKGFCNKAKSTSRGYRVCQHCKMLANTKAASEGEPFGGHCHYGLYEVAHPIVIGDTAQAIVYVGNAMIDKEKAKERIRRVCAYTGINPDAMTEELSQCEVLSSPDELFRIAELVADYLLWLYRHAPKHTSKQNRLVSLMKNHADEMFKTEINLSKLAETYNRNEKYMGRLFKKSVGMSFAEYKQEKRLELAESLLVSGNDRIIDIALECGFNNISYFNRSFQKKYGSTPTEYRRRKSVRKPKKSVKK